MRDFYTFSRGESYDPIPVPDDGVLVSFSFFAECVLDGEQVYGLLPLDGYSRSITPRPGSWVHR